VTIQHASALVAKKKLSSFELVQQSIASIEKLQPKLNAFITVMAETARTRARQMDEELAHGKTRGLLHGIPVAVKDVFCTKGVRTTCGSAVFADHIPDHDAAVVERLQAAGAVLMGKAAQHELAYGITSNNPHFGAVRNPWDTERIPGGSSGGSGAAVAAGSVFMAMGSDTGGSIRIPASFCGTVGLKPTTGRVSRYGVMPLDFTLDHMGPLTRSVRDAAVVLNVLAGHDRRDPSSSRQPVADYLPPEEVSIRGLKLGLPENFYFEKLSPEVESSVRSMVKVATGLGAEIVNVGVPDIAAINTVGRIILLSEASAVMEPYLDDRTRFGPDVLTLLDQGRLLPATDYINAQRLRRVFCAEFGSIWQKADCLLTPTTPTPAPAIGQTHIQIGSDAEDVRLASTRLVRGINVLGLPAISLPCGFSGDNLPVGLQLIGPAFREELVLRVAAALEDATSFHDRMPAGL
jgi:aspartyl-tRNA(Asn)/glutamyl-tRNA(Gln) amidotransferase subunit A